MRVWYDTEFWERGGEHPIEFISMGLVAEDDRTLYVVNADMPWFDIVGEEGWVAQNVLTKLPRKDVQGLWRLDTDHPAVMSREACKDEVASFLAQSAKFTGSGRGIEVVERAELWAYFSAYDHVVLSQLFGRMVDLPPWVPMFTKDLKQLVDEVAPTYRFGEQDDAQEHNALFDALELRKRHAEFAAFMAR